MTGIPKDLQLALRRIRRAPLFATVAIATLALGIGGSTAIFSVVDAVLLEPLPFPEPDRLARVYETSDGDLSTFSPPNYQDVRDQVTTLADVGAYHGTSLTLTGEGAPAVRIPGTRATASFFTVLGVTPLMGRTFLPEEAEPGNDQHVLLAEELWRTRFGEDPDIVGRTIRLHGEPYRVVGVLPDDFSFPDPESRLWLPRSFTVEDLTGQRGAHYLNVIGRLADGATLEQAEAELAGLAARLEADYPDTNTGMGLAARPLHADMVEGSRTALLVLLGAVGLVLVIAAVNVANLFLVRAMDRRQEFAVRAAMGAPRRRLAQEILVESLLVAGLGGAAGVLLAWWGTQALVASRVAEIPRLAGVGMDARVLLFAAAVSMGVGVMFGLFPAWRALRGGQLAGTLGGARGRTEESATVRLRSALVTGQVALAVVLLAGAGLLGRSFLNLTGVDTGIRTENLLTLQVSLPDARYPEPIDAERFFDQLLEAVEAVPGVERAGAVFGLPLSGFNFSISVEEMDGAPAYDDPGAYQVVHTRIITPGYMEAMDIEVIEGRGLSAADRSGAPHVVLLNRSAARLLWPGETAVGHTLEIGTSMGLDRGRLGGVVVGVVEDIRHYGPAREPVPELYVAHAQFPDDYMAVAVHTAGDPTRLIPAVRDRLARLDPEVPMYQVRTGEQLLGDTLAEDRFYALLVGLFGLVALILAAVGLYGVMAYLVRRRTREIGIRKALGAGDKGVLGLVLRRAAVMVGVGALIGLVMGLVSTRALSSLLFELRPDDPLTLVGATLVLCGVALLATWIPARTAARIEPAVALREE